MRLVSYNAWCFYIMKVDHEYPGQPNPDVLRQEYWFRPKKSSVYETKACRRTSGNAFYPGIYSTEWNRR